VSAESNKEILEPRNANGLDENREPREDNRTNGDGVHGTRGGSSELPGEYGQERTSYLPLQQSEGSSGRGETSERQSDKESNESGRIGETDSSEPSVHREHIGDEVDSIGSTTEDTTRGGEDVLG